MELKIRVTKTYQFIWVSPGTCFSHCKSGQARQRPRSAFKGSVRGMDDGPNSFIDEDARRASGKEQGANEENKNSAYGALENYVHGVSLTCGEAAGSSLEPPAVGWQGEEERGTPATRVYPPDRLQESLPIAQSPGVKQALVRSRG